MREVVIERRLVQGVRDLGGLAWKFDTRTRDLPDRLILLPGGQVRFVEVKRPGQVPRPGQMRILARLQALGFQADWVASAAEVDRVLTELQEQGNG